MLTRSEKEKKTEKWKTKKYSLINIRQSKIKRWSISEENISRVSRASSIYFALWITVYRPRVCYKDLS